MTCSISSVVHIPCSAHPLLVKVLSNELHNRTSSILSLCAPRTPKPSLPLGRKKHQGERVE